jgi:hypothetical protein
MGYNNEFSATRSSIIFDIETAPLPNAADYLEPVTAAKNLRDPEKIKADIEEKTAARDGMCGLDPNVARIVCIGLIIDSSEAIALLRDEADERDALTIFWKQQEGRKLVGFRIRDFDLPMMIQRSRYLGVKVPEIDLGRYARGGRVVDLFDMLTFQDSQRQFAMRRTLHSFCKRFGIPVADATLGAEIAQLVTDEKWGEIAAHCGSDIRLTKALAEQLGVLEVLEVKVAKPMPSSAEMAEKLRVRLSAKEPVL